VSREPDTGRGRLLAPGPNQSWLELFYDLAFVAAIVVLSSSYSNNKTIPHSAWLMIIAGMIWVAWLETTLLTNRTTLQRVWPRVLTVLQMGLILVAAIAADDTIGNNTELVGPLYALVLVTVALQFRSARRNRPDLAPYVSHHAGRTFVAALLFAGSPLYGDSWYWIVWVVALAIIIYPGRSSKVDETLDAHHLVHRFGEFTIIVLGESFLKIGLVATEEPLDRVDLIGLPLTFGIVYIIWWLYFTDVTAAGLPDGTARRRTWIAAHLPLQVSIMSLAVGLSLILNPTIDAVESGYIRMILLPLVVIGVSLAILNLTDGTEPGRRRARVHLIAASVLLVVFVGLQLTRRFEEEATALLAILVLGTASFVIRRIDGTDPAAATR
jgi:low temperature requirement protein LtrA